MKNMKKNFVVVAALGLTLFAFGCGKSNSGGIAPLPAYNNNGGYSAGIIGTQGCVASGGRLVTVQGRELCRFDLIYQANYSGYQCIWNSSWNFNLSFGWAANNGNMIAAPWYRGNVYPGDLVTFSGSSGRLSASNGIETWALDSSQPHVVTAPGYLTVGLSFSDCHTFSFTSLTVTHCQDASGITYSCQ